MSAAQWQSSAPADFELAAGEVHVWCFDLDLSSDRLAEVARCLSGDERKRAAKFAKSVDRDRYRAAHGFLRWVLGWYMDAPPDAIPIWIGSHGKPGFDDPDDLQFNLSHSVGLALVAVAERRQVGVDVELARNEPPEAGVAEMAFGPAELAAWRALPAAEQTAAFYRNWTRREAWLKARGVGLSGLDRPPADLGENGPPGWPVIELPPPRPGFAAALCVEGDALGEVRLFDSSDR